MLKQIFDYILSNQRHRVSVGIKLPEGKIVQRHRKIFGQEKDVILSAIQELKNEGVTQIAITVYRPNGTAEVAVREFVLPSTSIPANVQETPVQSLGQPQLFETPVAQRQAINYNRPQSAPKNQTTMESQSWKDYALKTEQQKVERLERELAETKIENKDLDRKVREFEKEMIKKDHELEKALDAVERKGGLGGVVDSVSQNPVIVNAIIGRLLGEPMAPAFNAAPELEGAPATRAEQQAQNVRKWFLKQDEAMADKLYTIIVNITNANNGDKQSVMTVMTRILNMLTSKHVSGLGEFEINEETDLENDQVINY